MYVRNRTCSALNLMILPLTLQLLHLRQFTPPPFIFLSFFYLGLTFFMFLSPSLSLCTSVQVYRTPSLIVFSHRSPGMCRHGLIIPADRCDLQVLGSETCKLSHLLGLNRTNQSHLLSRSLSVCVGGQSSPENQFLQRPSWKRSQRSSNRASCASNSFFYPPNTQFSSLNQRCAKNTLISSCKSAETPGNHFFFF